MHRLNNGASLLALAGCIGAVFTATSAAAKCVTNGAVVECTGAAPNPEPNGAIGTTVNVRGGATVEVADPYAGARVRRDVITVLDGGSLYTEQASTVLGNIASLSTIAAGANTHVDIGGSVRAVSAGQAITLGQGASLDIFELGSVQHAGSGIGPLTAAAVIGVSGSGTNIHVSGTALSIGDGVAAIRTAATPLGSPTYFASDISVGGSGRVSTSGADAPAIAIGGGSRVTVSGVVRATGSGSGGIIVADNSTASTTVTVSVDASLSTRDGAAIRLGAGNDEVSIAGNVNTPSGTMIDLGAGDDHLRVYTSAFLGAGAIDGGAGDDTLHLDGDGVRSFAGADNFERVEVDGGNWVFAAPQVFARGVQVNLGGHLAVNATNASTFTVATGGRLSGTGSLGGVIVEAGGTILPGQHVPTLSGSPIGTLTITGNFLQQSYSTFDAQLGPNGTSDRIVVGGTATIQPNARLVVSREAGATVGTRYTLLTAAGGITGSYSVIAGYPSDAIDLRVGQTATTLYVDVARSALGVSRLGVTANQKATAAQIATLGATNAAYAALSLVPQDADATAALDLLSGEGHASARLATLKDAQVVSDAVQLRSEEAAGKTGIWGQFLGSWGREKNDAGIAGFDRNQWGMLLGADTRAGDAVRIGAAFGYTRTKLDIATRATAGKTESYHLLGYADAALGPVRLRLGGGYAWASTDLTRSVAFTGYAARLASDYDGHLLHGFAEIGAPLAALGGTIEPFAGVATYSVRSDAFQEKGGDAALRADGQTQDFTLSTLGVRGAVPLASQVTLSGKLGWQHGFGDIRPGATLRFASGNSFTVEGAALSRDAATVNADLAWRPSERLTVAAGYRGVFGDRGHDNGVRLRVSLGF